MSCITLRDGILSSPAESAEEHARPPLRPSASPLPTPLMVRWGGNALACRGQWLAVAVALEPPQKGIRAGAPPISDVKT